METRRRHMLTEPGNSLLLAESALENAYRFSDWRDATGLEPDRILVGGLCSVPLPVYTAVPEGARQFPEVRPEMLWHPLFWLPPRLAIRYGNLATGPDGGPEVEADDLWSIRVGLELSVSGLYEPEEGWVDVLSTVGIDVDNPADVARIARWQAGAPDEILDSIDLDLYLHLERDPNWALQNALALRELMTRAQWALLADSLIEYLMEVTGPDSVAGGAEMRGSLKIIASLAGVQLGAIPAAPGEETAEQFWSRIENLAERGAYADKHSFLSGPVAEADARLTAVRDGYWASLDELQSLPTA